MSERKKVVAKPTVEIKAGDLKRFIGKVSDDQQRWCEAVLSNNAPGQKIYVDKVMFDACSAGEKPETESGFDIEQLRAVPVVDLLDGAAESAFTDANITTVGEILDYPDELSAIHGIGPERGKDTLDAIRALASPSAIKELSL